ASSSLPGGSGNGSGEPGAWLPGQSRQGAAARERQRRGCWRAGSDDRLAAKRPYAGSVQGDDAGDAPGGAGRNLLGLWRAAWDDVRRSYRADGPRSTTALGAMGLATDRGHDRGGSNGKTWRAGRAGRHPTATE